MFFLVGKALVCEVIDVELRFVHAGERTPGVGSLDDRVCVRNRGSVAGERVGGT